jgi:8-oxo-dGTP pyrophosphatase MutT (NUDIX family)
MPEMWNAERVTDLLTTAQTAAALRDAGVPISAETLRRYAHAGLVTPAHVTPGGWMHFKLEDVQAELESVNAEAPVTGPRPAEVVAAIITSERGVLITRRQDGDPPWGFVTGKIDPGESPADAAKREAKEEVDLRLRHGRVIGKRKHPATGKTIIYVAARPIGSADAQLIDTRELAEIKWVSLDDALEVMPSMFGPVQDYLRRSLR